MQYRDQWWVIGKYSIFQLPGIALVTLIVWWARERFGITDTVAFLIILGWIIKDILMFPLVRKAYGPNRRTEILVGSLVTAEERISPTGYVRAGAELWRAELVPSAEDLPTGARARVLQVKGLTLVVDPISPQQDD